MSTASCHSRRNRRSAQPVHAARELLLHIRSRVPLHAGLAAELWRRRRLLRPFEPLRSVANGTGALRS